MSWNHKTRRVAMAVAIQSVAGVFTTPSSATDLIAVSVPNNNYEELTAADPTATGTIWESSPIFLGRTGTAGASFPLRGPGGASPPAANAFAEGRVMQAGGWAEIINASQRTGAIGTGSTTTAMVLAGSENATDGFLVGVPIQHANVGTGFRQTTLIADYIGSSKTAALAETLGVATPDASTYTIPAYVMYRLGTLVTDPPILSISIWRDKKRYDYRDWRPTSIAIDMPVANDANQSFPSIEFSGRGIPHAEVDEDSPALPDLKIATSVAPARGGKFYVDRTKLGHQSLRFTETLEAAAPSNQNQDAGQDGYEVMSGSRTVDLDLNAMNVSDFDIKARVDNRTLLPIMSTWGLGAGNRWGFLIPKARLNAMSPGDRNGFVNLSGAAEIAALDKSAVLTCWW